MSSLYKSEKGKNEILNLYDEKLKELNIEYQYKTVDTKYGQTNIIISGDDKNPPIILVHGSNGCAPIALETYPNLRRNFRVYAIDVLAQPNKSAETRLNMKDDSYGKWINEVIDSLKIENVIMAGFSFGGLVILKTLEFNESKIKEVYLSAPAYIVNGNPLKALFKIFIPMKRYMKTEKVKYVEKFLSEIFTERDEFAVKYLSKIFLHFKMDFTPVPVIKKIKANSIKTPITLFAGKNDILFPGNKMIKRAKKIFPTLISVALIEDSKHVQSKKENELIEKIILEDNGLPHNIM
ncbi:alpha/beta hydrolase [Polaribacter sp. Hel1_85]|uniref:alpha/beta hydrolase n=1 Tax=Polaribacter sp. Hel1_85 TaxID=1250005 RepID=UPI00052D6545|nr:alpha/beta hydrolase [Polaribacter sp. Hel1_85]KGL61733.1 alpha/beta hydrolase family protein [Polaribacter sp. Hel1_85]